METKTKSTTQRCGRCHRNLKRDAYSPSKWGHAGKWCRACRRAYRVEKVGAKKAAKRPHKAKVHVVKSVKGVHVVKAVPAS